MTGKYDEKGQMIIMTAMVAGLLLISIAFFITSVKDPGIDSTESPYLTADAKDNILWAQDASLDDAAARTGSLYAWDDRVFAVNCFKNTAAYAVNSLADNLQMHGVAYQFSYNRTLSNEYILQNPGLDLENIDGVLVYEESGDAKIYGCSYDAHIYDGITCIKIGRITVKT
ncbi:hypothetical protein CUJ83_07360 [Methanocella sp. CWC-04]|uniref:Uncharacterized protein n=1 Tax=Methanooceanicella nereidis TaxID=2052831 RepID=A0AAP2RDV1_9EURY|nr:hypothetical protein [Methanocella sp. CWC-04]MCD1294815.1 hypothetical protein [Methanocella sp. CWC-04]